MVVLPIAWHRTTRNTTPLSSTPHPGIEHRDGDNHKQLVLPITSITPPITPHPGIEHRDGPPHGLQVAGLVVLQVGVAMHAQAAQPHITRTGGFEQGEELGGELPAWGESDWR